MKRKTWLSQFIIGIALLFSGQKGMAQGSAADIIQKISSLPDSAVAGAWSDAGDLYYLKGMNDSAVYCFENALGKLSKQNDEKRKAGIWLSLAKCKIHLQKFEEGTELLFQCIRVAEKESLQGIMGNARSLVSFVYNYQGKATEGLRFATEAERIFEAQKDTAGLLFLYPILITSFGMTGDTAKAISYFYKGMKVFDRYEKSGSVSAADREHLPLKRMALIFNSLNVMFDPGDLSRVLAEINKVDGQIGKRDNLYEKFEIATLTAVVNLRLKNFREAQQYAEKAISYTRPESDNHDQLRDVYQILAIASDSLGDFPKAYRYMWLFKQYNDSVFKTSSLEAIHSVEAKYETQKKEQKIAALNEEKRAQKRFIILSVAGLLILLLLLLFVLRSKRLQKKLLVKEQEIQRTELEKKMFELQQTALRAQMNPHFIFNCLNSVQRYVINNDVKGVNSYLSTFASLIRQTLENSGKQSISLKDELQYLETYIKVEKMRGGDNFEYEISVGEDIDTSDIYLPGMIIQPFVENSILHGMGDKNVRGKLKLTAVKQEKLIFVVEDNGPGINKQDHVKPVEKTDHEPMGGSITVKRIEMYNNLHEEKIEFSITGKANDGADEPGTKVTLAFPIVSN